MEISNIRKRSSTPRCRTRRSCCPAIGDAFRKLDPRHDDPQPGDVRGRGRRHADHHPLRPRSCHRRGTISASRSRSISGCGSPCCSPISPKPWPKAAARRRRRRCARPRPTPWPSCSAPGATTSRERSPRQQLKQGDIVLVEAGDLIPSDGEVIEGVASVDEAAITGESAPVIRESGGDRSAVTGGTRVHVRLDQGADHRRAGLDLPRPHDRAGRRRRAAEDAQRDRAEYPARRPDDHLRLRRGDHSELCRLCRRHDVACWCWWRCS